jgi:vacuolar protein sorting-associated protein VTA1
MDQFKSEHAQEPAVTDDIVGKAYIEQFGLETFQRADNAVRVNKASRQTADTFQAAATFLDLLRIWGAVEPDISEKIKFAKYHALRIAKALKAGEDPNLSNPAPQTPADESLPTLDPDDADVKALEGGESRKPRQPSVVEVPDEADKIQRSLAQTSALDESLHPSRDASLPPSVAKQQPTVTDVPDDTDKVQSNLARQSSLDQSLHPSRAPSAPPGNDVSPLPGQDPAAFYTGQVGEPVDISPLDPPSDRKPSLGGNYFPVVPSAPEGPDLPSAPTTIGASPPELPSAPTQLGRVDTDLPPAPSEPSVTSMSARSELGAALNQPPGRQSPPLPPHRHGTLLSPQSPTNQATTIPPNFQPQAVPPPQPINPPQLRPSHGPTPPIPQHQTRQGSIPAPTPIHPPPQQYAPVAAAPITQAVQPVQPAPPVNAVVDEEAIMKAQKHARWAISALNFEDVPTAIRELKGALASLGST